MHGLADRRVPWQQSQQFYDALRASGVDARLVLVADADHEFGGISDERRRQQVDIVIEWLGSHNQS
jgi:dipeptidyl aminopeptidase/acylaminoacyl peptidase